MWLVHGTIGGLGTVAGGLVGMGFSGYPGFVIGAMAGTLTADALLAIIGMPPASGKLIGIKKGIAGTAGAAAGLFFAGLAGMVAAAIASRLASDLVGV